jgi:uncharacterized OB-fold protein
MKADTIKKEWSLDFDFSSSMGETCTEFMEGLKEKKFLGNKIGGRTFFPMKPFCDRTFELPTECLEIDGSGIVEAFTVYNKRPEGVAYPDSEISLSPPFIIAVIRINDSDQCFLHFLSGIDPTKPAQLLERVEAGLRVRPVWAEERHGNILDIKYYEPIE